MERRQRWPDRGRWRCTTASTLAVQLAASRASCAAKSPSDQLRCSRYRHGARRDADMRGANGGDQDRRSVVIAPRSGRRAAASRAVVAAACTSVSVAARQAIDESRHIRRKPGERRSLRRPVLHADHAIGRDRSRVRCRGRHPAGLRRCASQHRPVPARANIGHGWRSGICATSVCMADAPRRAWQTAASFVHRTRNHGPLPPAQSVKSIRQGRPRRSRDRPASWASGEALDQWHVAAESDHGKAHRMRHCLCLPRFG